MAPQSQSPQPQQPSGQQSQQQQQQQQQQQPQPQRPTQQDVEVKREPVIKQKSPALLSTSETKAGHPSAADGAAAPPAVTPPAAAAATGDTDPTRAPSRTPSDAQQQNGHHLEVGHPASPSNMSNGQPPTPGTSYQQHHQHQHHQHMGYAPMPGSSPVYARPGIHPGQQHSYGAPPGQAAVADYHRNSARDAANSMSLPSMRTLESTQQQQQQGHLQHQHHAPPQQQPPPQQQQQPIHMQHHIPAQGYQMGGYYGGMPPAAYYPGMGQDSLPRYGMPIPLGAHQNMLSGGRHKKEIKRRTKTGCLTCRKRRIKCDEGHPTCNNCRKSKRDCLGYDPIFKQQHGPPSIQPAQNSPSSAATSATTTPTIPSSITQYSSQPPVIPSNYAPSTPSTAHYDTALSSAGSNPPTGRSENFEFPSAAIDPSLETAASRTEGIAAGQSALLAKGGVHPSPVSSACQSYPLQPTYSAIAAKMKVEELLALGHSQPPANDSGPTGRETLNEIVKVYYEIYVTGFTEFFETRWYNLKDGNVDILLRNKPVIDLFASFLNVLSSQGQSSDTADITYSGNLEQRVVWNLACLAYSNPASVNQSGKGYPQEDDAVEARNRLHVFQALLQGEYLDFNPLMAPLPAPDKRREEFAFWYHLADFLLKRHRDDHTARENALTHLRNVLGGRENRDVLYSIAVMRQLYPTMAPDWQTKVPAHHDERDQISQLHVATEFIQKEPTGGTTNVVRRLCELAIKAFINPGTNRV